MEFLIEANLLLRRSDELSLFNRNSRVNQTADRREDSRTRSRWSVTYSDFGITATSKPRAMINYSITSEKFAIALLNDPTRMEVGPDDDSPQQNPGSKFRLNLQLAKTRD
jgi:hypothetical protein